MWRATLETSRQAEFAQRCRDKFDFLPLFDWFVGVFRGNYWPLLLASLAVTPVLFLNIKYNADEFLAKSILSFQRRFRISATVAAVTLMPLSNAGPDLIVTLVSSGKQEGVKIAVGSLIGAFTFVATIAMAYIVHCSPNAVVEAPVLSMAVEVAFYALGLALVAVFGALVRTRRPYALLPLGMLLTYMAVLVYLTRSEGEKETEEEPLEEAKVDGQAYETRAAQVRAHLYDAGSPLSSALVAPFKAMYMLTVPYADNPLTASPAIYAVVGVAVAFCLGAFDLTHSPLVLLCAALIAAAAAFGLGLVSAAAVHGPLAREAMTLCASIAYIKLLTSALIACVNFGSFVMGLEEGYLSMTVLSIGMSVSDVFSGGTIAAAGRDSMALLGCISSQIFTLLAGVASFVVLNPSNSFDIFSLRNRAAPTGLFTLLLIFAVGALALNLAHVAANKGYQKSFVGHAVALYAAFLVTASLYAFLAN